LDGRVHAFGGLSDVRKVYTHTDKSWPVDMQKLNEEGNAYLDSTFPEMTRLVSASVIETWAERKLLVPKRRRAGFRHGASGASESAAKNAAKRSAKKRKVVKEDL
jgi:hypothetical protein